MNWPMNPDDFEQRLRNQPLRQVPAEWRAEILSGSQAAAGSDGERPLKLEWAGFEVLRARVLCLFWPSPKVWLGLASIWLLLAGVNRAILHSTQTLAGSGPPASASLAAWKERERILTELIPPLETPALEAPRPAKPLPRSELTRFHRIG